MATLPGQPFCCAAFAKDGEQRREGCCPLRSGLTPSGFRHAAELPSGSLAAGASEVGQTLPRGNSTHQTSPRDASLSLFEQKT